MDINKDDRAKALLEAMNDFRYHKEISEIFDRYDENWTEWCMDNINIAEKDKETEE